MQRITSALVLFLLSVFNLIADPLDYGKDYSFREGHSNTPIWFVILVIVGEYNFQNSNLSIDKSSES